MCCSMLKRDVASAYEYIKDFVLVVDLIYSLWTVFVVYTYITDRKITC
jgi:hypothetical protein